VKNFLTLVALVLASLFASAQSVEPGLWSTESSVEINGLPLPPSKEQECLLTDEAKDIKKSITNELKKNGCTTTQWTVKGDQLEVALTCNKSGLNARGNLKGTITSKSYKLNGKADGTYQNFPAFANFSLKGLWIKSCPK